MATTGGLFDNFTHVNTSMNPADIFYKYPTMCKPAPNYDVPHPNKPYENYTADGRLKGYFWYWGDSVELIFNVNGELTLENTSQYINAAELLESLLLTFNIFDHRHQYVLQYSNYDAGLPLKYEIKEEIVENIEEGVATSKNITGNIIIEITHEISKKLPKGTYTCSLTASHPDGYHETLFGDNTCTFEIR